MFGKWGPLFLSVMAGFFLAFLAIMPPAAKSQEAALDQFSSARAMDDVRIIAAAPHPTGSIENAKVRDYLIKRLTALGLETSVSASKLTERALTRLNKWGGTNKDAQTIFNIIGVLPGENRTKPALLLMAHHDTVFGSPGAADDTAGIASILEILRAVKQDGAQQRDVIVLFTDGEELGLVGAVNFFNDHPLRDKIGTVINFEARGGGGRANMFQTSVDNGDVAKLYARSVKQPSTSSLSTFVYNVLPNDTDLTPALVKDYTAYNIANIGGAAYYHSPKITADALDERTLQHMGSQGLDLTRALLAADTLPSKTKDATFFDLFGLVTVIYAPFWGWGFLLIAVACYGASASFKTDRKDIAIGVLRMTGFLVLGGLALYGLNRLSGSGAGSNYYDRLAAIPKLECGAFFFCLTAFIMSFGSKPLSVNARLGAALPLFILAIMGQALAPTASYFLTLTLLFCAVTNLVLQRSSGQIGLIPACISAALILGYMMGLGHLLMLGVGADVLSAMILPAALAALAVIPLYAGLPNRLKNPLITAGFAASIAVAFWVRLDPMASTIPLY